MEVGYYVLAIALSVSGCCLYFLWFLRPSSARIKRGEERQNDPHCVE